MNKVILQIWEESNFNHNTNTSINIPIGCTIHLNLAECNEYLTMRYKNRIMSKRYESAVSLPIHINVTDSIMEILLQEKTIHLSQNELNNLIEFKNIICF